MKLWVPVIYLTCIYEWQEDHSVNIQTIAISLKLYNTQTGRAFRKLMLMSSTKIQQTRSIKSTLWYLSVLVCLDPLAIEGKLLRYIFV